MEDDSETVRMALKKTMGRTTLMFEEMNIFLIKVESMVNAWLLIYVKDD